MKRAIETAAWTTFWASWIALALIGPQPFGILIAISAFCVLVRMAMADGDGYEQTVFGRESVEWDRIIANGGLE